MNAFKLILLILLLGSLPVRAQNTFKAGAAAVDISPTVKPFQLRSGPSTHVHDPLHVRAVAFENGEGRALIALMDAIGYGRERADEAKMRVAAETGWTPEQMLVCATHAHTAPKGGVTSPGRIAYEERRFEGLVEAMTKAIENLQPARVGFASDEEPSEVRNRRWYLKPGTMDPNPWGVMDQVRMNPPRQNVLKPAAPVDPEVCVIDVRTQRNKPLALVANYALHYVGGIPKVIENGREVGMASSDYFGEFARIMPFRIGGSKPSSDFVALMTNGSSGDINNLVWQQPRPPRAPFEQVRIVASKTADAAWRAVQKIEDYDAAPLIAVRQREVSLKYRVASPEEIAKAQAILALPRKERASVHKKAEQYANATLRHTEAGRTEPVIIQAIRIGEQAVVSMPFEVLVEIGLELKAKSPFKHTFLIELANGGYGYLPPPNQHALGGYETWLGTSKFEPDSSVILIRNLLEMLGELKALGVPSK